MDTKPSVGLINPNEEDQMKVTGYRFSHKRNILCWLAIVLTAGLLRLILHWWSHWYLIATHEVCALDEAEKVIVEEEYQGKHKLYYVKKVIVIDVDALSDKQADYFQQMGYNCDGSEQFDLKDLHLTSSMTCGQLQRASRKLRYFNCKHLRYLWDEQTQSFVRLKGLDENIPNSYFHHQRGLSSMQQFSRRLMYDFNEISLPYSDVSKLIFIEALNPFYVFQFFSVVLWFTYDYYYYACVILLMSIFGIAMSTIQTKKNQDDLRKTIHTTGTATVLSDRGDSREISTRMLVPGDIIEIPALGCVMQCDAVLLSGNCIVDESMLTGESVPITKTSLPRKHDEIYNRKEHARHTLFCGTKVIQTRYMDAEKVLAFVISTGNITEKGGLVRSILYPPPVDYKFEQDSYKFIACMSLVAMIGFVYTLVTKIRRQEEVTKLIVESLDLITVVVPPALPAAMSVGRYYAQRRLEKQQIYCISPRSINVAGSIDCCCFDKTGTLTEDGLNMWGVVPKSATNSFQIPIKEIERLPYDHLLFSMVSCHSITIIEGNMMGDPLDLKMFESTGWTLEDSKDVPDNQKYSLIHPMIIRQPRNRAAEQQVESSSSAQGDIKRHSSFDDLLEDDGLLDAFQNHDHGIVREFPFSSALQRMSVITRRLCENHFNVYCKGSPEMIQQLCLHDSIPDNYSQQLACFAKQGYRVIATAYKPLSRKINFTKAQRLAREAVETDLQFLGFVVLENRLKPDTSEVIKQLNAANIRSIMVTGDNILTALSVARDCGIVDINQAIVTVNTRLKSEDYASMGDEHRKLQQPNYELYYTLELGSNEEQNSDALNEDSLLYDQNSLSLADDTMNTTSSSLRNYSSLESIKTWSQHDMENGIMTPCVGANGQLSHHYNKHSIWRQSYRFAMVGKTWQIIRDHFPSELETFITRGAIFARMSPEQKQALIIELQSINYCVAMCGDGSNDCGALKAANTGISLSEAESSIASPFTSRNPTIAAVPKVIKEGRAALVTSFGIFKYMAAYSMVQFVSVMILYEIKANLTDKQYLYIDLGLISVFAFFFGKTESYRGKLNKNVPLNSLISLTPLLSLMIHLIIVVLFQVAGWIQLHQQEWFQPFVYKENEHFGCHENYTIFAISSFQYIILAFVFSTGAPYRRPIWSNVAFCLSLVINTMIVLYLILYPAEAIADFFQFVMPPQSFRYVMLIYGICSFVTHTLVEVILVEYFIFKKIHLHMLKNVKSSNRKYIKIEHDLQQLKDWPKICEDFEVYEKQSNVQPNYVEIKSEQTYELPPIDSALNGFFHPTPGAMATAEHSSAVDAQAVASTAAANSPIT